MKKKFLRILNLYSLLYLPIGWVVGLAIIFIANLELGFLTPPVGMNLFLSAYRFNEPMPKIYKATLPFFLIKLLAVALITYIPILTLGLFNF